MLEFRCDCELMDASTMSRWKLVVASQRSVYVASNQNSRRTQRHVMVRAKLPLMEEQRTPIDGWVNILNSSIMTR